MTNLTYIFQKGRRVACVTGLIIFILYSSTIAATRYEYDTQHRLSKIVYDNGKIISYKYDASGNRIEQASPLMADMTADGIVNFKDFATLAVYWLSQGCSGPSWCGGADIDHSTMVDIEDIAKIAQLWLEGV